MFDYGQCPGRDWVDDGLGSSLVGNPIWNRYDPFNRADNKRFLAVWCG
jgi:hypothetical protein